MDTANELHLPVGRTVNLMLHSNDVIHSFWIPALLAQHDQPYTWGRPPSTYLPFRAIIRLAILRSKLESLRNEPHTWLGSTNERAA